MRPTDDPNWKHEHTPTGQTRKCSTKGCKATWALKCHNHNRKLCDPCRQGRDRKQDRERKRASRLNKVIRAEEQLVVFGRVLLSARELAQKRLSGQMTKNELAAYLRVMSDGDWLWDDLDYPDDM